MSAFQQVLTVTLEGSALNGRQLLPEALADAVHGFVGHAHDVELIDHDMGLWQYRLDRRPVGLPHVHADDLQLVAVGHVHEAPGHRILLATREQVQQGALFQVGQDATITAVQVQLVDTQAARRLEAVPGRQELGLLLEDLADGLLVEARSIGHVGVGVVEGFLLDMSVKPASHAVTVHDLGQARSGGLVAGTAHIAAADHPQGDPLAVHRQVAIGALLLAEPDELALNSAILAGDGGGSF